MFSAPPLYQFLPHLFNRSIQIKPKLEDKNDIIAVDQRNIGNNFYKSGVFYNALIKYNASLCYSESELNMALAYANRSAVYFELKLFEECIFNIDMAIKHNYPHQNIKKLHERKSKCLEDATRQNSIPKIIENFFKLSYPANPKLPFLINDLELKVDKNFDRGIYATRDLYAGDIIAIEKPFYSLIYDDGGYRVCCVCMKSNFFNLFPCSETASLMVYSEHCMKYINVLETFDKLESLVMDASEPLSFDPSIIKYFLLKNANFDKNFLEEISKKCEPVSIFDYDLSDPTTDESKKNLLRCAYGIYNPNPKTEKNSFENTFAGIVAKNRYSVVLQILNDKNCDPKLVGNGLFLFGSLLNHSCDPNLSKDSYQNQKVYTVIKPVKKGEQIFVTYDLQMLQYQRDVRRQHLLLKFNFLCKCTACMKDLKINLERPMLETSALKMIHSMSCIDAIKNIRKNYKIINKISKDGNTRKIHKLLTENICLIVKLKSLSLVPELIKN